LKVTAEKRGQNIPVEVGRLDSPEFSFSDESESISVGQAHLFGRFELAPCPIGESVLDLTILGRKTVPNNG
jgi:hypothetical protein